MKKSNAKAWIGFLVVALAQGIMFRVPYLKNVFYTPMQEAFDLTNTQIGLMMTFYSTTKIITYIPAGMLADRLDGRKALTLAISMLTILTVWYSFGPSFQTLCLIQVLLGLANVLQLTAQVKVIRTFGNMIGQGKAFGTAELIRGVASLGINFLALGVYAAVEVTSSTPMRPVLLIYAVTYAIMAILAWFLCPKEEKQETMEVRKVVMSDYVKALKMPAVWVFAFLTMAAYSVQVINDYTTPYLTNVMGMGAVLAGAIGTIRSYGISLFSGPLFGWYNDKKKSYSRTLIGIFIAQLIVGAALIITPADPGMVGIGVALILLGAIGIYGFNATQWALQAELDIPIELSSTVAGIVCVIGYTPDIFMSLLIGTRLDNTPGAEAYKSVFVYILVFAAIALIMSVMINRMAKKIAAKKAAEAAVAQS